MHRLTALILAIGLITAACSSDQAEPSTTVTTAPTTTAPPATTTTAPTTTTTSAPAATTTTAVPNPYAPGGITPGVLFIDEIPRHYFVAVPPDHNPDTPAPLLFDLHGRGGTAPGQAITSKITDIAWLSGFVVVHPQAFGEVPTWSVFRDLNTLPLDVAFFSEMIDHFAETLGIDESKVFVTGFSNGGGMAGRLACELGDRIAAIAPVGASNEGWTDCEPAEPISVLAIHGVVDEVVPYDGGRALLPTLPDWIGWWAEANACVGEAELLPTASGRAIHWGECADGTTVSLLAVDGIGHIWPERVELAMVNGAAVYLGATQVIMEFFNAQL